MRLKKCKRCDCFAYNKELKGCIALKVGARDAPGGCTFYKSDPDDKIKKRIKKEII